MVGRLVEEEHVRFGQQQLPELDPHQPAAAERVERPTARVRVEAEALEHAFDPGLAGESRPRGGSGRGAGRSARRHSPRPRLVRSSAPRARATPPPPRPGGPTPSAPLPRRCGSGGGRSPGGACRHGRPWASGGCPRPAGRRRRRCAGAWSCRRRWGPTRPTRSPAETRRSTPWNRTRSPKFRATFVSSSHMGPDLNERERLRERRQGCRARLRSPRPRCADHSISAPDRPIRSP